MEKKNDYFLTNESIDEISENVSEFLTTLNTENKNLLRIRLMVEELLLCWQEHFSPEAKCQLKIGCRFRRPFIQLELEGDSYNPLNYGSDEYGEYHDIDKVWDAAQIIYKDFPILLDAAKKTLGR